MVFDPFVEIGFEKKVADGGGYQVYRKRGRGEKEREACVVECQVMAVDSGYKGRKKDGIDLNEGGLDSFINVSRRPSHQDSWTQGGYQSRAQSKIRASGWTYGNRGRREHLESIELAARE